MFIRESSVLSSTTFRYSILACSMMFGLSAQAASEATELKALTVNASVLGESKESDVKEYAGSRTVISAEQMTKTAAKSIDDALQQVPGVKVQDETGTGVLPNVSVRGLSGSRSERAQFLMDGVPLTLAPYGHTGQSVFPATLSSLERIDVVRGGAAVQYGPNNVGGVINLVTKPIPKDWESQISNRITGFEHSNNTLNNLYLRTGGWVNDDFAIQLEANTQNGDSARDHSDTDVQNFQIKTDWLISDTQELQAFVERYEADTEMPGALSPQAYRDDRTQSQRLLDNYDATASRWHLKYMQDLDWGNAAQLEVLTFGHHDTRDFIWGFRSGTPLWSDPSLTSDVLRNSPREFTVYGVEPKLSVAFGSPESVTQNLIVGMRYVNEDISYKLNQRGIGSNVVAIPVPRDWHLETNAVAGYVSDEIGLMNDRLKVTPGVRFESVHMNMNYRDNGAANQQQSNQINEALPSLTVAYNLTDEWVSYVNAQKSLRAPQIAQVKGKGHEDGEISWNYEVGARYTKGLNSFNVALYLVDYKDQLQSNSQTQTVDNIGETKHQGIEVSGRYSPESLPDLTLGLAYTYLDATLQESGENKGNKLPFSSKNQISWDASYNLAGYQSTVSGYYYSDAFSDNANTVEEDASGLTGKIPSYTVWNLNVSKDLYEAGNTKLSIDVAINNVFDKEYYFRGVDTSPVGRYPAVGRTYSVTGNLTF
ncbi:TonB-dependent siderophore receptor [Marinomonas sp. A3A]|uniref:TonB-dependent receptor family protein n=1 Tax=Marinomonas sp. A3A TaxID=2065312 RepID=UPI001BB34B96|nr:TonB-dependent siderophore receptor [Marinomonas sp. A3A]QUX90022.1 TonB-dependent siderophore receptor [Marinomonas sp. A3A]